MLQLFTNLFITYFPSHSQNCTIPREWCTHYIIPIYKSGEKSMLNNYRPISLLCSISKITEGLVYNQIIAGNLWKWFLAYLTQRKQFVAISGTTSQCTSRKYSWTFASSYTSMIYLYVHLTPWYCSLLMIPSA